MSVCIEGSSIGSGEFCVPISDAEWFAIGTAVLGEFRTALGKLSGRGRNILLCDFDFLGALLQELHRKAVEFRALDEATGSIDLTWTGNPHAFEVLYHEATRPKHQLAARVRSVAKSFYFNIKTLISRRGVLAFADIEGLGSVSALKFEYLRNRGTFVRHRYLEEYFDAEVLGGEPELLSLQSEVAILVSKIGQLALEFGVSIDVQGITDAWLRRLASLNSIYTRLVNRGGWPRELLVSDVARPLVKLVSFAARENGVKVIGFSHGNYVNFLHYEIFGFGEPSHFDCFVLPTSSAANGVAQKYRLSGLDRLYPVKFLSADSTMFGVLARRCSHTGKASLRDGRRVVMLMGFPMNGNRYLDEAGAYSPIRLDLELRLAKVLRDKGYYVIYKGHPDRRREVEGIFDGLVDEVEFLRFETVWKNADVLLFTYVETSCFHTAICTNRTIVLFDHADNKWFETAYSDISKRCQMIPASFDENNRIVFDEKALASSIEKAPAKVDYSIVDNLFVER